MSTRARWDGISVWIPNTSVNSRHSSAAAANGDCSSKAATTPKPCARSEKDDTERNQKTLVGSKQQTETQRLVTTDVFLTSQEILDWKLSLLDQNRPPTDATTTDNVLSYSATDSDDATAGDRFSFEDHFEQALEANPPEPQNDNQQTDTRGNKAFVSSHDFETKLRTVLQSDARFSTSDENRVGSLMRKLLTCCGSSSEHDMRSSGYLQPTSRCSHNSSLTANADGSCPHHAATFEPSNDRRCDVTLPELTRDPSTVASRLPFDESDFQMAADSALLDLVSGVVQCLTEQRSEQDILRLRNEFFQKIRNRLIQPKPEQHILNWLLGNMELTEMKSVKRYMLSRAGSDQAESQVCVFVLRDGITIDGLHITGCEDVVQVHQHPV